MWTWSLIVSVVLTAMLIKAVEVQRFEGAYSSVEDLPFGKDEASMFHMCTDIYAVGHRNSYSSRIVMLCRCDEAAVLREAERLELSIESDASQPLIADVPWEVFPIERRSNFTVADTVFYGSVLGKRRVGIFGEIKRDESLMYVRIIW
jgi:hypothetical protein